MTQPPTRSPTPRARARAARMRVIGLTALAVIVSVFAMVRAAFISRPFGTGDIVELAVLIVVVPLASLLLARGLRREGGTGQLTPDELVDATDLAAVMVVDDDGIIRHWSRGCEELYGWSAAEAVGRMRLDLLRSQLVEPVEDVWMQLRLAGRLIKEVVERHRDGHELVVHDHAKLLLHDNGRCSAVIAVTDVTEWRRAEEALRLSEARLATSVAVQGIFIYEYDLVARQPIWTTSGQSFFGLDLPEAEAHAAPGYWSDALDAQVREILLAASANGQDRAHFDFGFRYPDGTERRAEGWARIIRDGAGEPVRLLGTNLDVTERRERELALRAGEAERQAILATVPDAMFV